MAKAKIFREDYKKMDFIFNNKELLKDYSFFKSEKLGERRYQEFIMWINGASYKKIGEHFGISVYLVQMEIHKAARIADRLNNPPVHEENPYTIFMDYLTKTAVKYDLSRNVVRAFNAFVRRNGKSDDYLRVLKSKSDEDLLHLRGIGVESAKILMKARDELNKEEIL